jgi:magnesium transporter
MQNNDHTSFRDDEGMLAPRFLENVTLYLDNDNKVALTALLKDAHAADVGDLLETLHEDDRLKLINLLGDDFDFEALTEIDEKLAAVLIENLPTQQVAEGLSELDTDDAVALLENLDDEDKEKLLEQMPAPDRLTLERSLTFPEGSAGRLMKSDFIAVPPFWTIGQTIDFMRESSDLPDDFTEIFVVDPSYQLVGILKLDKVLRAKRPALISQIMTSPEHYVEADEEEGEVARTFERYNLIAAPVIDASKRLVGVLTIDDIVDIMSEEADSEIKSLGGVDADEELTDKVKEIFPTRVRWLFVNMLAALFSAFVISRFEETLKTYVAVAFLMPIVASMGGNAGTQTMTVIVRALATQELSRANAGRVLRREVAVGFLNGLFFAICLAIIAHFWFPNQSFWYIVGTAVTITLTVAALGGFFIPYTLEKMGVDPAIASGPFVTTITDIVGFTTFLGLASLWLV